MQNKLFIYEEILLLALRDKEGTIASGTMYQYAIGGAIAAELLLNGRIEIERVRKKDFVKLVDSRPFDNQLLNECIERISDTKRRATIQTWVSRFAGIKNLKHIAATELCNKGILRADENKIMHIFTRKIYPEINPAPERELIERLRRAIFTETQDIDAKTVVVLSLADSSGLLRANFNKQELKTRKVRIKKIVNGEIIGTATKQAIEAMQAATMVACIMPAVMASTACH